MDKNTAKRRLNKVLSKLEEVSSTLNQLSNESEYHLSSRCAQLAILIDKGRGETMSILGSLEAQHRTLTKHYEKVKEGAVWLMKCPRCGAVKASASEREYLPEFITCECENLEA